MQIVEKVEVAEILSSVDNIKPRAILMLVYSAGLQVKKDLLLMEQGDNMKGEGKRYEMGRDLIAI